jgi:hypothetical protein
MQPSIRRIAQANLIGHIHLIHLPQIWRAPMKKIVRMFLILTILFSGTLIGPASQAQGGQPERIPVSDTPPEPPPNTVFIPLMNYNPYYVLSGQIIDSKNAPMPGVKIVDNGGHSTLTDANGAYAFKGLLEGEYSFAPQKDGVVFSPSVIDASLPGSVQAANFNAQLACADAVVNGSFETADAWVLPITEKTASYTTAAAHTGTRSLRTGIFGTEVNKYSYSSGRQTISIPAATTSATLRVWLYPVSEEAAVLAKSSEVSQEVAEDAAASSDAQYVLVLDANNNLLQTLLYMRSNGAQWSFYEFNLTKYAGKTIKVQVGTVNDGYGGRTGMYVDDVVLELCDSGTVPPPPPATPCSNYFGNPGFEATNAWGIPVTRYPAGYSMALAHSGVQSMRTGIVSSSVDVYSYSDAYQEITIPSNATSASLSMWFYPSSAETTTKLLPKAPTTGRFEDLTLASDLQYILVLNESGFIVQNLLWQRSNSQTWTNVTFDLLKYKGQAIRIQFGTFNDGIGGNTSMYVDDAALDVCVGVAPTPTVGPPPPPTPPPGICIEKFGNNGFELIGEWGIPITAFSAGYSTNQAHTGSMSMRNGIIASSHNRYSYSDAYQTGFIELSADSATIGMWIYPITGETPVAAKSVSPTSAQVSTLAGSNDVQYVLVLDVWGNWIDTLLWTRSNAQTWTNYQLDVSKWAGMTIRLQFGVYNDGYNGVTAMYVDDTTMQVCP